MKYLYNLFTALVRLSSVRARKARGPSPIILFLSYAKLKTIELISGLFHLPIKSIRIFGYEWSFINLQSFAYVFEEVFIEQPYLFDTTKNNPLILDCGANIGLATLYFKMQYPNSTIVAFEPSPETAALFRKNIENNKLTNVTLVPAALAETDGYLDFNLDPNNPTSLSSGNHLLQNNIDTKRVNAVRLSSYLTRQIDFLKMDIEGAELDCLSEAQNALSNVQKMVVECHHFLKSPDRFNDTLSVLRRAGFHFQVSAQPPRHIFGQMINQDILVEASRL